MRCLVPRGLYIARQPQAMPGPAQVHGDACLRDSVLDAKVSRLGRC